MEGVCRTSTMSKKDQTVHCFSLSLVITGSMDVDINIFFPYKADFNNLSLNNHLVLEAKALSPELLLSLVSLV